MTIWRIAAFVLCCISTAAFGQSALSLFELTGGSMQCNPGWSQFVGWNAGNTPASAMWTNTTGATLKIKSVLIELQPDFSNVPHIAQTIITIRHLIGGNWNNQLFPLPSGPTFFQNGNSDDWTHVFSFAPDYWPMANGDAWVLAANCGTGGSGGGYTWSYNPEMRAYYTQ